MNTPVLKEALLSWMSQSTDDKKRLRAKFRIQLEQSAHIKVDAEGNILNAKNGSKKIKKKTISSNLMRSFTSEIVESVQKIKNSSTGTSSESPMTPKSAEKTIKPKGMHN